MEQDTPSGQMSALDMAFSYSGYPSDRTHHPRYRSIQYSRFIQAEHITHLDTRFARAVCEGEPALALDPKK